MTVVVAEVFKKNNTTSNFLLTVFFVFFMGSCSLKKEASVNTPYLEISDSYNRKVVLYQAPQHIVSLSPALTEMVFTLHSGKFLIGRTEFCNFPDSAQQVQSVGNFYTLNTDLILNLKPDLILSGSIVSKTTVELFEKAQIPVICLKEEQNMEGLFKNLRILGQILGQEALAEQLSDSLETVLQSVKVNVSKTQMPKVYYVVGYGAGGDYTAYGDSHIGDMIRRAGGLNIAENAQTWKFSRESLFFENPDIIFIRQEDLEGFCKTKPYTSLKAVRQNRVYGMESGWVDVLTPRSLEGLLFMAEKIGFRK